MGQQSDPQLPPIRRVEEIMSASWPDLQATLYDGWVIRYARGMSKRSNSVWPLYPPAEQSSVDLADRVDHCEQYYRVLERPVIFKLTNESIPATLDGELDRRGYTVVDTTIVQTRSLRSPIGETDPTAVVEDGFSDAWLAAFEVGHPMPNEANRDLAYELFDRIRTPVQTIRCYSNGIPIGCGYAVLDSGLAGLFAIWVDPDARRRGVGARLTNTLLASAREAGADHAYLQVVADNDAAVRLYARCGFDDYYRYWYRVLR